VVDDASEISVNLRIRIFAVSMIFLLPVVRFGFDSGAPL